ncbi:MAG: sensor histidine kinase [Acidimicrobiales bacterium]
MSLRLRLASLVAATTLLVVAVFAVCVYSYVAAALNGRVDRDVTTLVQASLAQASASPNASLRAPHVAALSQLRQAVDTFELWFARSSGERILQTANADGLALDVPPEAIHEALAGRSRLLTVGNGPYRLDIAAVPGDVKVHGPTGTHVLGAVAFGESLGPTDASLGRLRLALGVGGGIAVLVAILAAWVVAGRALRPVRVLARAASTLGTENDPSRRLPYPAAGIELAGLANAFNASLERLEAAYRRQESLAMLQREFTADASHDLRTPLAVMRTSLETLERHPELPTSERAAALSEVRHETERMSTLVEGLLELAQADHASGVAVTPLNWTALLNEVVQDFRRICSPRRVQAAIHAELGRGKGDRASLVRVMRILAENVAHHTPAETSVLIAASREGEWLAIAIADDGPGVSEGQHEQIFERFSRANQSRPVGGAGLGLSIARRLIETAGGDIGAAPVKSGGFVVRIRLPAGRQ